MKKSLSAYAVTLKTFYLLFTPNRLFAESWEFMRLFFALRIDFGGIRNIGRREDLILFFAFPVQAPHQYHYIRDPLFFRPMTLYLTHHLKRFAIPATYKGRGKLSSEWSASAA